VSCLCTAIIFWVFTFSAFANEKPIVRAILFIKPNCAECTEIITTTLSALKREYQEQLKILAVYTSTNEGGSLYLNAMMALEIPPLSKLPTLVVGKKYLGGVSEIDSSFHEIIERVLLDKRGVVWPSLDGLEAILANTSESSRNDLSFWVTGESIDWFYAIKSNVFHKIKKDPIGNTASIALLIIMVASILINLFFRLRNIRIPDAARISWVLPLLALVGMGISAYLTYIKYANTDAFCGPIGDCNAVQNSSYSSLFGFFPVSLAGFCVFLAIFVFWILKQLNPTRYSFLNGIISLIVFASMLFFVYLTFLEPFVIGATCIWCLSAALDMTLLYWLIASPSPATE